jgi:CBS domain-containing protein
VLGLVVIWIADEVLDLGGDGVLVSLLVLPALLYLALSGRLTEITGPGGVSAKFREVAAKPARASSQKVTEEDVQLVQKGGLEELRRMAPALTQDHRPIVFAFAVGRNYNLDTVRSYVDVLVALRRFLAVVFLDPEGRLLGYMPAIRFVALTRSSEETTRRFIDALSADDAALRLHTIPGVITETLGAGSTNSEALEVMTRRGLEILVLVDDAGRFAGVVERGRVLSDLVLAATP